MTINVTKRDGRKEPINLEKFHRVVSWACEGLTGVSVSEVEIRSNVQFYDKIKTSEIQETLIKASAGLITEDTPNYQYVAGRLINYHLRKQVYGERNPTNFSDHVQHVVAAGYYDPDILESYSIDELNELDKAIVHERDMELTYAAMEQFRGKYLIRNRVDNTYYETPQMVYMMIAATLFSRYPKNERIKWVKEYYDAISQHYISLPTPIMAGVRTNQRQFSSCVLIESGDSLDTINSTTASIVKYVSQRAGIGIGAGGIRAVGSPIRNGDTLHTGVIPFFKLFQAAVKSCSQGGVRGGAATLYYPIWHYEVEDLLVLKNNKGTEDTRARGMDYGVQFSKLFYERLMSNGNITLFSPRDVPGLYDAFFADQEKFVELYEKAEKNSKIRKKVVKARELFSGFMQERKDTGRIYLMNVDHVNDHSSFVTETAPIHMSNLCCEITEPTKPLQSLDDPNGEIALCTLSATNWGKIKNTSEFEWVCRLTVRGLDALLSYQNYPILAAQLSTEKRRNIGIGIVNLAYWMAKNDISYQDVNAKGLALIHEWTEAWSYYIIKASIEIAEEQGPCPGVHESKYGHGILPIDTYKKDVDTLCPPKYKMNWEELRANLKAFGIRNSTLMAQMPCETSAQIANATNGIEPPRALVSIKQSKDGILAQVVPEIRRLKNKYDLLWDQKSPEGYLKICAILQKFIDQAISVNTSYNPKFYPDEQVPMSDLLKHMLMFYKFGGKNLYYCNTNDQAGEHEEKQLEVVVTPEEDCDACKL